MKKYSAVATISFIVISALLISACQPLPVESEMALNVEAGDDRVLTVSEFEAIDVACADGNMVLTDNSFLSGKSEIVEVNQAEGETYFTSEVVFYPDAHPRGTFVAPGTGIDLPDGSFFVIHHAHGTGSLEGSELILIAESAEGLDLPCEPAGPVVTLEGVVMHPVAEADAAMTAVPFEAIDAACADGNVVLSDEPMMAGSSAVAAIQKPDEKDFLVNAIFSPEAYPDSTWISPGKGLDAPDGSFLVLHWGIGTGQFEGGRMMFTVVPTEVENLPCEPVGPVVLLKGVLMLPGESGLASVSPPIEVSGATNLWHVVEVLSGPAKIQVGSDCFQQLSLLLDFADGTDTVIVGTATAHFSMVAQGPCDEFQGPDSLDHDWYATGTFEGKVGEAEGTFDFTSIANVKQGGEVHATMIVDGGTGELENIRGVLYEDGNIVGEISYAGRVYLEQPSETASQALENNTLETSAFELTSQSEYGRFNGIDYRRIEGKFTGTANGEPFSAPFEIVAPIDPDDGNGRIVVEPFHFVGGAGAREDFLTPEFLFNNGFSHASVCWQLPADFVEDHPCLEFEGIESIELQLISSFAKHLHGAEAVNLVGDVEHMYSIGFSNSADPLHLLLLDPRGQGLFDLSFLVTTGWPHPIVEFDPLPEVLESTVPPESAGSVMVIQAEADLILWNGAVLRDASESPNYRLYEIAGAPHIPGDPLDWTPVLRALFLAGDRWVTEGSEPPPSTLIDSAPAGEIDALYDMETGIARDEDLNALGGIRMPDLSLGSRQHVAVDTEGFPYVGLAKALHCNPMEDGSVRFEDHETYVTKFEFELNRLIGEGFLLQSDAEEMLEKATQSEIGRSDLCP